MKRLHANSVFHFTSQEGLLGILKSNFLPKHSKERFTFDQGNWDYWIPMVCFCDIPLSLISDHIDEYGNYGIGMKREWVHKSRLNPVFYYQADSDYHKQFNEMMSLIHLDVKGTIENNIEVKSLADARLKSRYLFHYYKPCHGHDFKIEQDKWFYDEREWRYVPYVEGEIDLISNDNNGEFLHHREKMNQCFEKNSLLFEPKDVSYIILQNEEERWEFCEKIRRMKSKYSYEDVEILTTKIITVEQIKNDM